MNTLRASIIFLIMMQCCYAESQPVGKQQGMLLKTGTNLRLGSIRVLNARNKARTTSNSTGVFTIAAQAGDTLIFNGDTYAETKIVVTDHIDKIIYMEPITRLDEVVIKANSLKADIKDAQLGYRRKGVFYTGTPHYYYLVLKPMTFIYENFKSEVIEARRFNRFARQETMAAKVAERFTNAAIKKAVPITDADLDDFKDAYTPTMQQLSVWNDLDLVTYIRTSYIDFECNKQAIKNRFSLLLSIYAHKFEG